MSYEATRSLGHKGYGSLGQADPGIAWGSGVAAAAEPGGVDAQAKKSGKTRADVLVETSIPAAVRGELERLAKILAQATAEEIDIVRSTAREEDLGVAKVIDRGAKMDPPLSWRLRQLYHDRTALVVGGAAILGAGAFLYFRKGRRQNPGTRFFRTNRKLTTAKRKKLPKAKFAYPEERKLPIHDASHVRNAMARFNQTDFESKAAKTRAYRRLVRAAGEKGIDPSGFIEKYQGRFG